MQVFDKMINWIKKHVFLTILFVFAAFLLPLLIIHLLFSFPLTTNSLFTTHWSAGELLGYVAAFISTIGTVTLAAVAIYQNHAFIKENQIRHERAIIPLWHCTSFKIYTTGNMIRVEFSINNESSNIANDISFNSINFSHSTGRPIKGIVAKPNETNPKNILGYQSCSFAIIASDDKRKIETLKQYIIAVVIRFYDSENNRHLILLRYEQTKPGKSTCTFELIN